MQVITYSSPDGPSINLTVAQVDVLEAAECWPKDGMGREYCDITFGQHEGTPTYSDAEVEAFARGEDLPL